MRRKIVPIFICVCFMGGLLSLVAGSLLRADTTTITDTTEKIVAESTVSDSLSAVSPDRESGSLVYTLFIEGPIGVVTDDRIGSAIAEAEGAKADLLIIILDTPGGFSAPTWSISKRFFASEVPVCVYIAPSGARAGSAGVYMTYAAHFAAMAPSTNIGAAHPVGGGGQQPDSIMNEKITNDAVAQIKAAAERRGRNGDWAEKAVRQSVSITNTEALALDVIDFVASDIDDLLEQINGRETETGLGKTTVKIINPKIEEIPLTFVQKLLQFITHPDVAFILFSLGGLGIVIELYNPGAILPGIVGAISLILSFYAFQTLPINWAGVALILLAIVMFILEIKIISHGLLTIGGIIALFLGGLMLIDTVDPVLRVSLTVLITTAILIGATAAAVLWLAMKAQQRQPFTGVEGMIGRQGQVRKGGFIYVEGALWKYLSDAPLESGDRVEVTAMNNLTLTVRKVS
ncbi:MAG: nodulation protein NfeD [candidate division Zixibacteria bacterium]|nr:nodulation protein NfeD [candidate division Zixibacteria bacterium]